MLQSEEYKLQPEYIDIVSGKITDFLEAAGIDRKTVIQENKEQNGS